MTGNYQNISFLTPSQQAQYGQDMTAANGYSQASMAPPLQSGQMAPTQSLAMLASALAARNMRNRAANMLSPPVPTAQPMANQGIQPNGFYGGNG